MSVKGSWPRGKSSSYCTRDCGNRDKKCAECWKFDMFEQREPVENCQKVLRLEFGMDIVKTKGIEYESQEK